MISQEFTAPAFPLKLLLLPGETYVLHIYENRYRQLVKDCIENHAHFIMPYKTNKKFYSFGAELRIVEILKIYPDGRMDILVECVNIFHTTKFSSVLEPKLYGAVQGHTDNTFNEPVPHDLHELAVDYLEKTGRGKDYDYFQPQFTLSRVANFLRMNEDEKLKFILSKNKVNYLKSLYKFKIEIINVEKRLGNKFVFN
ncbi:MAG: LON peptidase substrate-binding domain-containing protein [Bacteroidia bacterium]|nr:LON peptidase substrate-binding domain-containing protein [Bacteroidia bacterium]